MAYYSLKLIECCNISLESFCLNFRVISYSIASSRDEFQNETKRKCWKNCNTAADRRQRVTWKIVIISIKHFSFFYSICLPYTQSFSLIFLVLHRDTRMPLSYTVVGIRCIHMSVIIYSQMNATSKHLSHMHLIQQQNNSYWHECAASTTSRHMIILRKIAISMGNLVENYN